MSAAGHADNHRLVRQLRYLILALISLLCLSVLWGRYSGLALLSPTELWQDALAQRLVVTLRLPRVLMACLLGMGLAASGSTLQMIFRNPLVEPGFLGVSQGAAFGAACAVMLFGTVPFAIQGLALFFAGLGVVLSYVLARHIRFGGWVLRLVLSGIAISALFASGVGVLKYVADPLTQLPEIVFWMLGGLYAVTWSKLLSILPVALPSLVIIYLMRWRLNLLSMGEQTAFSLGAAPTRERAIALAAAVGATAAVVSVSGVVGWVGLIVPHIARRIAGSDAQKSLPVALLLGGIFALMCDNMARTLLAGELPLGTLTSLFGAGLFILLMTTANPWLRSVH
ncbi:MAG: iron ABC transporter permease, partial [Anaerolineae bacterium]|nr:iron ABC transporter permease [Anaerolineae bacterium]MDW8070521.1 iron ABC transporter permease [Anaerolineae bacterium]